MASGSAKTLVLVVDDEPDIREAIEALLGLVDVEVVTAPSGASALDVVAARGEDLRLVISDYKMPGMDGLELLARIEKVRPDVLRILVTAFAETTLAVRAINEARVSRFLAKPIDPVELEAMVKELLAMDLAQRQRASALQRSVSALGDRESPAQREPPAQGA